MKNAQINVPWLMCPGWCVSSPEPSSIWACTWHAPAGQPWLCFRTEAGCSPSWMLARESLRDHTIALALLHQVKEASVEEAVRLLGAAPTCKVWIGVGSDKALVVAKYTASLVGLPYFAVPTFLSNDGFCSPQASLTLEGKRRSLPTGLLEAVVVDLAVCRGAPRRLWHSGVGELCSEFTAVSDWKLAFHRRGVPVNDLAALMSAASVFQFMANPVLDEQGIRRLATALNLNEILPTP